MEPATAAARVITWALIVEESVAVTVRLAAVTPLRFTSALVVPATVLPAPLPPPARAMPGPWPTPREMAVAAAAPWMRDDELALTLVAPITTRSSTPSTAASTSRRMLLTAELMPMLAPTDAPLPLPKAALTLAPTAVAVMLEASRASTLRVAALRLGVVPRVGATPRRVALTEVPMRFPTPAPVRLTPTVVSWPIAMAPATDTMRAVMVEVLVARMARSPAELIRLARTSALVPALE